MEFKHILGYVKLAAVFVVFWAAVWVFNAFSFVKVPGSEMSPAVESGLTLGSPGVRSTDDLRQGDVVLFAYTRGGRRKEAAARVIGLPGDRVKIEQGQVLVNGQVYGANLVGKAQATTETLEEVFVPRGTVFLLCDNRKASAAVDSRAIGPVGIWAISAKL